MKAILLSACLLLFIGCSNENKKTEEKTNNHTVEEKKIVEKVQETSKQEAVVKEEVKAIEEVVKKEVVKEKDSKLKALESKIKDKATRLKDKVVAIVPNDIDEVEIYNGRCAACHGHNAEKAALGKSQVIRGWTAKKIEETLHAYKNGTYGGALKAMMQSQASKLSDEETQALSKYISNL